MPAESCGTNKPDEQEHVPIEYYFFNQWVEKNPLQFNV